VIDKEVMLDNLHVLALYLDKIDINWGPAFGTLIGIVRNDDFQPWKPVFDIYILKEDEERFKDILWSMMEVGFELVRYERRGLYYLRRNGEIIKVFVLHKICSDVRHTGGSDFIHEKYLQNTVKWDFKGIKLNVPVDVDEYLTFQYGDWVTPKQTVTYSNKWSARLIHWVNTRLQDSISDSLYYFWLLQRRKNDFKKFRERCEKAGIPLPKNVQLESMKPRKYKKVLTVGVYDLIHKGHIELYRRAKGLGDYLIVAVQDSDFILKYKPDAKVLNSTEDRKYLIKSIRYVDEVITYTDVDKIVKEVEFDVFITGADQCHSGFQRAIQWCEENGKEHIVLGRTDGVSSSELKKKIALKTSHDNESSLQMKSQS
jgi:glycerol-3-phosphate cytidylyltransferase